MKIKNTRTPLIFLLLLITLVTFNLCNKDKEDDSFVTEKIAIGENYQGGIIFYIDASSKHGWIAATTDQSITAPWWNGNFIETKASSLSDGSANTSAIITAQGNSGIYAAKLCKDYRGGNYNNWFLPSKDQLNLLFSKKAIVGGFSTQIYWSSTEHELGAAWVQDFETGEQHLDNISDEANVHTRAIRGF